MNKIQSLYTVLESIKRIQTIRQRLDSQVQILKIDLQVNCGLIPGEELSCTEEFFELIYNRGVSNIAYFEELSLFDTKNPQLRGTIKYEGRFYTVPGELIVTMRLIYLKKIQKENKNG